MFPNRYPCGPNIRRGEGVMSQTGPVEGHDDIGILG